MHAHTIPTRFALLVAGAALLAACGNESGAEEQGPQLFEFKVDVLVEDTNKKPIVKAPVQLDGKTVGFTDKDGHFLATLRDEPGKEIEVRVAVPEGFAQVSEPAIKTKLKIRAEASGETVGETVALQTQFEPAKHEHLVWIALECAPELPVGACADLNIKNEDDEIVATTDPLGRAHILLNGMPGKSVNLTVETRRSAFPEGVAPYVLSPTEPTFHIDFNKDPEVFVIKQTFARFVDPNAAVVVEPKKNTTPRVSNPRPKVIKKPTTTVTKPKTEKKKDPNKKEVIDLF